jgi:ribosomal protein S18 acetylase RimI-like enzyme
MIQDWRTAPSGEIAVLLARERSAWLQDLHWDLTDAWRAVEPARRAGTLPGFVARDGGGCPVGWTAFLRDGETVQVLACAAPTRDVARSLVDAILGSADALVSRRVIFCVREASGILAHTLGSRGFLVEPYRYLTRALSPAARRPDGLRAWAAGDAEPVACLLARAYDGASTVRAFAPGGTMTEWREYVRMLVATTGCGRFAPHLSAVVPNEATGDLAGAVLVTDVGPGTAHVAQMAVAPAGRARGLGRRLLATATDAAAEAGYTRMTLLVGASNRPAASLYERAGFRDRSRFVVAVAGQPILSTSFALATGGESTRR